MKQLLRYLGLLFVLAIVMSVIDFAIGTDLAGAHALARAMHYMMYMAFGAYTLHAYRALRKAQRVPQQETEVPESTLQPE